MLTEVHNEHFSSKQQIEIRLTFNDRYTCYVILVLVKEDDRMIKNKQTRNLLKLIATAVEVVGSPSSHDEPDPQQIISQQNKTEHIPQKAQKNVAGNTRHIFTNTDRIDFFEITLAVAVNKLAENSRINSASYVTWDPKLSCCS